MLVLLWLLIMLSLMLFSTFSVSVQLLSVIVIVAGGAVKLTYVSVYGICYHGHVGVLLLYSEA